MEAAFIPEVNGELDTQNFEKFEEVLISFSCQLLCYSAPPCHVAYRILFAYFGFGSRRVKHKLHPKLVLGEK